MFEEYMQKRMKIWPQFKKVLANIWYHLVGGGIMLGISLVCHLPNFIHVIAFVVGAILAENLNNLHWYRRIRSIAKVDRDLLNKAANKRRSIYLFERKVIEQYHTDLVAKFNNLFARGVDMTFSEYQRLLRIFIQVAEESIDSDEIRLEGTCLILPNKFNQNEDYSQIFVRFYKEFSRLNLKLLRILCNHRKENLIKAIQENKEKFEQFCTWNKNTGFDLLIFGGDYDSIRLDLGLPLNDFGIFNKLIVIGGEVTADEKIATSEIEKMIIKKTCVNYDFQRYDELLTMLKTDDRCMKLDHEDPNKYESVINFLQK